MIERIQLIRNIGQFDSVASGGQIPLKKLTLAYAENLIGSALFAAPVMWLTGNLVLAVNVVALLSCALCGFGAYLLGRRLGMSPGAAVCCGIIFAFSPPRFMRTIQIHIGAVQWIPFTLAALHRYFDEGRKRHIRLAAAFATLQALTSGHGAVFTALAITMIVLWRVALGEPLLVARALRDLGAPGLLLFVPAIVVFPVTCVRSFAVAAVPPSSAE